MIVALIDNGSLQPAAHRNLRAVAAALSERTGVGVHAVSWKHSDRIPAAELDGTLAWTLWSFVRTQITRGEREFVFVPFFISPQGAIGSALRDDLEALQRELGHFGFTFTDGLSRRGAIPTIVAARVRETLAAKRELFRAPPSVVVVDHGGPSAISGALRDALTAEIRTELGDDVASVSAASMEGSYGPLLVERLRAPDLVGCHVMVAPLFLSPGRHAGPGGDLDRICRTSPARCHITGLVGDHPAVVDALATILRDALAPGLRRDSTALGGDPRFGGLLFAHPLVDAALEAPNVPITE